MIEARTMIPGHTLKFIKLPIEGTRDKDNSSATSYFRVLGSASDFIFLYVIAYETIVLTN